MGRMQQAQDEYLINLKDETIEKMIQENPEKQVLWAMREEARERVLKNVVHLEKLDPYKAVPREKSAFVKKAVKADKNTAMTAPLVYGAVVQASSFLYQPLPSYEVVKNGNGAMVILFTLDEKYRYDKEWLAKTANAVEAAKQAEAVPEDMSELRKNLLDTRSIFCNRVGASVAGAVEAWCCTVFIDGQKELPKAFLPNEKILPFLVLKQELENKNYLSESAGKVLEIIDREFYQ